MQHFLRSSCCMDECGYERRRRRVIAFSVDINHKQVELMNRKRGMSGKATPPWNMHSGTQWNAVEREWNIAERHVTSKSEQNGKMASHFQ